MRPDWSDELLDGMRHRIDPVADEVVNGILSGGLEREERINELFRVLITNESSIPPGLPEEVEEYFHTTEKLPSWADSTKILEGEKVFNSYGPEIVLLLFCKALPLCYSCWRGAHVLANTGRLLEADGLGDDEYKRLNRRIMETAQFIINVMAPDGFKVQGRAIRSTQKVRLIHASIRYFTHNAPWNSEELGLPINQEDMAGTLMAFSYCSIEGLEQIGVNLSSKEQEAFLHCWRVIGSLMGVEEVLLPEDVASARSLTTAILKRQTAASEPGQLLTKSLTDYLAYLMPGPVLRHFPSVMIPYLVGDKVADDLGVKKHSGFFYRILFHLMCITFREISFLEEKSKGFRRLAQKSSRHLLQKLVLEHNDYKKVRFSLPPSLKENWQLENE